MKFNFVKRFGALVLGAVLGLPIAGQAAVFDAPKPGNDIIGETGEATAVASDTLVELGRRYNQGYREMRLANPETDPWLPGEGTKITLPTQYILPSAPREGIVLNVAEMRLYYFPPKGSQYEGKVITYPLGIGREGWATPLGRTRITGSKAGPTWTPPQSIKDEHAANGDPLPNVVPAGPDNPLGDYALYLSLPSYLLHGTNKPGGIGLRVSHGCIRLYPEDIAALFSMADAGTPVNIVNQPYKTGWLEGELYLEAHPPDGEGQKRVETYTPIVESIIAATKDKPDYPIDWLRAQDLGSTTHGMPVVIGSKKLAAN